MSSKRKVLLNSSNLRESIRRRHNIQDDESSEKNNVGEKASSSSSSEELEVEKMFEKGLVPEKILGAEYFPQISKSTFMFKMKWKGSDRINLVEASVVNNLCPQLVLDFYQNKLKWTHPPLPKHPFGRGWPLPLGEKYFKGREPEKILWAVDLPQDIGFLSKWKGIDEPCVIFAHHANKTCPQLVIQFYESRFLAELKFPSR